MVALHCSPEYLAVQINKMPNAEVQGQMIMKKRKLTTLIEV